VFADAVHLGGSKHGTQNKPYFGVPSPVSRLQAERSSLDRFVVGLPSKTGNKSGIFLRFANSGNSITGIMFR
jgi:hypothetical protein